jgi:5-methylcytosine-specific restriction endonuclease McrA
MNERQRIRIYERDGGLCQECGAAGSELDHVRPRSSLPGKRLRAERDDSTNLVLLCPDCHRNKRSNSWRNPEPKQQPPRWGGL